MTLDEAKDWIDGLLGGNGFGDDYSDEELTQWAQSLLEHIEQARPWQYGAKHPEMNSDPVPWSPSMRESLVKNQGHILYRRRRGVLPGPWEKVEE